MHSLQRYEISHECPLSWHRPLNPSHRELEPLFGPDNAHARLEKSNRLEVRYERASTPSLRESCQFRGETVPHQRFADGGQPCCRETQNECAHSANLQHEAVRKESKIERPLLLSFQAHIWRMPRQQSVSASHIDSYLL